MLEPSDLMRQGTTDVSTLTFSTLAGKTAPAPLSSIAKHAEGTVEDTEISQDLQHASESNGGSSDSENQAIDDNVHGDDRREEETEPKREHEKSCSKAEDAEKEVDADRI